ncbi:metalloendopeptidase OMA1, mitochondrial isoform X2 [Pseudophryne corroboree]|uniref:metalloendopeptidase OMA1, mitochondrial isoform X2 n=1 Tax=Pseudophryne corroboree TaxID=495146 RepID=UPI003081A6A9
MEATRHLMTFRQKILSLHRLISPRTVSCRASLYARRNTLQNIKSRVVRQTSVYCRPQFPALTTRCHQMVGNKSDGNKGLKNAIHGKLSNNYVQSFGSFTRMPRTLTVPQSHMSCAKNIHTTARRNVLLPPHVWLLIKPVQKLLAIILGRSVRKWWRALPANKRQLFKQSVRENKWKLSIGAAALGSVIILFYFTNLEETPITGRSRLLVFRKEHYDLLTTLEYESLIEEFKDIMLPKEDARYQLVQKIVDHLISCNSDLPEVSKIEWTIHVVDRPLINAFVLPNGQVFVFTGMLDAVANNDQLAFILGHELAHAILEHMAEKASVTHFMDFLFLISLTMIWAICPMDSLAVVGQWVQSKLREACVDVRASSVFWKQMEVMETLGEQPRIPEWLSTHPSHENRAEHLDRLIPKALKLRDSCNCSELPSVDPRYIFELSVKHLLQTQRGRDGQAIAGELVPVQVDDRVPLVSAVTAI